jgi:hypothetical protein
MEELVRVLCGEEGKIAVLRAASLRCPAIQRSPRSTPASFVDTSHTRKSRFRGENYPSTHLDFVNVAHLQRFTVT